MNEFSRHFLSAEYNSGYEKGYLHGIRAAAICLLIVGSCIMATKTYRGTEVTCDIEVSVVKQSTKDTG